MEKDYPQIARPVGSLKELAALGVPTVNIATCSAHVDRQNMGCPVYKLCDREFRDSTPQNQVFTVIKRDGNMRTSCGPCFDVVLKETQIEANGGLVKVVAGEGETFLSRGSVKLHPKRDPNCNECAQGKCDKYEDREDLVVTCLPFPAAARHPELVKFARVVEARQEGRSRSRKSLEAQLLGSPSPVVPNPEGPAESHGGRTKS
jgi:hypothetical protein